MKTLTHNATKLAKLATMPGGAFRTKDAARTLAKMNSDDDAYMVGNVRHWRNNDAIIPPFVYADAAVDCPDVQTAAREAHLDAFTAEYKRTQRAPSHEQRVEMRAAFGAGTVVVDVISGRRTKV